MQNSFVVSVIIPAYNAERTILETIASVQQQTFSDFEIIVINDGSTDRTLELVQGIQDERVKIFSYENGGLPVARNRGISRAKGEFIAFIDADDMWTSDKLELQVAILQQHPEAGVAYSWSRFMNERGELSYVVDDRHIEGNVYEKLLLNNFLNNGSSLLVRREAIESAGKFDPTLKSCEDWDFYLRLAAKWSFVLVPKPQILYRQSSTAMTSKIDVMESAALITIERAYQAAPPKLQYLKNQTLARLDLYFARQYLERSTSGIKEINLAGQKLWKSIRLHPPVLLEKYTHELFKWFIKRWTLMWFEPRNT
ncbi:MAG: glycosyltransferase family A protein [Coleofasciculaceae cyanobacterium]